MRNVTPKLRQRKGEMLQSEKIITLEAPRFKC